MSNLDNQNKFEIINPQFEHFADIQELCKKVYPFSKPWSIAQLEAHHSYFPEGQLVVIDKNTNRIVGLAFSLIISWDDYSPQDNWQDFTSGGFFHNHNPRKGKTLYGAEVMVDPEYRGKGIGGMLYRARQDIVRKYNLKRIRAGARLRGYSKFKDKYTPEEYAIEVVNKRIFDPTLSFQLNQNFTVLDVAKNYLFNDPESLGFAAVIEWLNPDVATEKDIKRQRDTVVLFLANKKFVIEHLPKELRRLIRKMTLLFGEVIQEYEGEKFYERIEYYRQRLKKSRSSKDEVILESLLQKLKLESPKDQYKFAHGFSVLLEMVNVCEAAYRTWRQRQKGTYQFLASQTELNFVLTAHPTEARPMVVVNVLRQLTDLMVDGLQNNFILNDEEIRSKLGMLWLHPLVKSTQPTVLDEAEYIFSVVFNESIFDFILSRKEGYKINLHTWVGGDKDGHPGVDEKVMLQCLLGSRKRLTGIVRKKLSEVLVDLEKLKDLGHNRDFEIQSIQQLIRSLSRLNEIKTQDGKAITEWRKQYFSFLKRSSHFVSNHYQVLLMTRLFQLFPAMVLPIELREDAAEIKKALTDKGSSIRLMLQTLIKISEGADISSYVREFVISNCESAEDINTANLLVSLCSGNKFLPVVPLFETRDALKNSSKILNAWLKDEQNLQLALNKLNGKLEIMLGYSDSSKQLGVLASRHLIRNSMFEIETTLKKYNITPTFFHGSGGSIARGGGSLREQISWWPNSAIQTPKLTLQGEMIQRTFATKEILSAQCLHLSNEARLRGAKKVKFKARPSLDLLASKVETEYRKFVDNSELLNYCLEATPYNYLSVLKIGSRPTKRAGSVASLSSLRAIPWVLCWTQTRLLLPSWWGVGTAWSQLNTSDQEDLRQLYLSDPFMSSFVKTMGFTLAKVELGIWKHYLIAKHGKSSEKTYNQIETEYKKALKFFKDISQAKQLIPHRPWLEESVKLRSPYIHILNLLQIQAMQRNDEKLLKETLVGIACGMLTTG